MKRLLPLVLLAICSAVSADSGPIKVEVRTENGVHTLYRGGEPYYVRGAGGQIYLDRVAAYGGNSIRTWSATGAKELLDKAHSLGLTVTMGLWVGQERQGFNYDDEWAVMAQLEKHRQTVRELKDHPALLVWGVGNEMDLFYTNYKVWDAVNELVEMIHQEDPNHPTMVVTAGLDVAEVQLMRDRAPGLDILGINTYGGLFVVQEQMPLYGWDIPYMITEWGPNGHWEVFATEWGAPVELSSSAKAASYLQRYEDHIDSQRDKCLGSYVFLWGQKQEVTHSWYGVFTEDGKETEAVDVLEYVWSGSWPENRSPAVSSLMLDGKPATQNVRLSAGTQYAAKAKVQDPEGAQLRYEWNIYAESTVKSEGGDFEAALRLLADLTFDQKGPGEASFRTPDVSGAYRLFLMVYDDDNNVGTANLPFYVR